ncbi:hypothetical protein SCUP234_10922 [Seiridium cupressi]
MKTFITFILAVLASTALADMDFTASKRDLSDILSNLPRDPSGHGKTVLDTETNVLRSVDDSGNTLGSVQLRSEEASTFAVKERAPAPVSRAKRSEPLLQARDCSHYPCDEDDDCKAYDCHWGCFGDDHLGIGFCI